MVTTTALDVRRCRRCGNDGTGRCDPCIRAIFVPWTLDLSTIKHMRVLDYVADLREGKSA